MGLPARKQAVSPSTRKNRLARGKNVLQHAASAIQATAESLDEDFLVAVDKILTTRGSVIVCGIGKAGLVGRKISATFASTGTRSHFLHPSEAVHGDLGSIGPNDVMLMLSNSGTTEEIVRILPFVSRRAAGLIAITSAGNSPLARAADIALILPPCREACQHNLAPSTSTTSMLAMGDALALVVSEARGFGMQDFAELHPAGALGKRLASVDEAMRPQSECRLALSSHSIRQILVDAAKPGRRTGAVMLVDENGVLEGIFTDSDLAKLMEQRKDQDLDRPISERMTRSFSAIQSGARLSDAVDVMVSRKISELPVVNRDDKPIGMIDITDVLEIEHLQNIAFAPSMSRPEQAADLPEPVIEDQDRVEEDWDSPPTSLRVFGRKL